VRETNASSNGERKLRAPFLKVTDKKKKYQPLYKELTVAPSVSFEGLRPESPFERVTRSQKANAQGAQGPPSRGGTRQGAARSKKGYCELCCLIFENREQHMKSAKHRNNINSKNFDALDKLIIDGGSFTDFVTNINQLPQSKPKVAGRLSCRDRRPTGFGVSSAKDLSVREEKALQESRTDISRLLRPAGKSSLSFKVNLQLPIKRKKVPTKRRLFDDEDDDDVDDFVVSRKKGRSPSPARKRSKNSHTSTVAKVTKVRGNAVANVTKVSRGNTVAKVTKVTRGNAVAKVTKVTRGNTVAKVTRPRTAEVSMRRTRSSRRSVHNGRK